MRHISILLLFLSTWAHGQDDYVFEDPPMPESLNTIGLNLTPMVVVAFGGLPVEPRFGLYYKRQHKPNSKWRIQLNYETIDRFSGQRDEAPLFWNDTTIAYTVRDRDHWNVDLRFGLEYFRPGQKFTMVYGFDIFGGLAVRRDRNVTEPLVFNEALNLMVPSPFLVTNVNEGLVHYAIIGADFSIGQRMHLKDHVYLTLQWTPEIVYSWPIYERYNQLSARTIAPASGIDFRLRGIELYFHYMF